MRKIFIVLLFSLCTLSLKQTYAQSYRKLTDSALHVMWAAKDTTGYRKSLNLYEEAFKAYPQNVDESALYKSAVLSGELKEIDKSFGYLERLLALNNEKNNTWRSITGKFAKEEYKNLLTDQRWPLLVKRAETLKTIFFNDLAQAQAEFQENNWKNLKLAEIKDGKTLYKRIRSFNQFKPKSKQNYSIKFKVKDSLYTSYYVSLPPKYNPEKSYAVLFFLHGAVQGNSLSEFQNADILQGWNRFYTKYATLNDVIMVYPKASRQYNWMMPNDGFFMIPAMLKELKQSVNVDDDKVFITGHSNGATGSFSYLMKQRSPFAGFYGFNTRPVVRTGGTFILNIKNRSFFNVSTDQDYYFPPEGNDSLNVIMKSLKADYQDHRYNGFPHWFPQFDESEAVYPLIFKDIKARSRMPFRKQIYWECDDINYGKADWLHVTALDTNQKAANWHKTINFNIHRLLAYNKANELVAKDTLLSAFNFPRKSGVVKGYYSSNTFRIETSRVGALKIFISPEMVDMDKPVWVYVNGKLKAKYKPLYNRDFIIRNFNENYDRKASWADELLINVN
ncbi:alpha/beta hydrolase [Pedobacter montanisoli]|uniref:Phospholipase n=1 Tax=Pedobacter montanisoli TaxID=2923277 RepID=A0ABS9ZZ19_9SPHI|nr:hypothetical protein [Pedobacter montanisoli]MCJ0743545.1 hypothetical protein [Pedobacter montanisoli]